MSAMHRRKGARVENELVTAHKQIGIHAERVPLSGGAHYQGRNHDVDVYARGREEAPLVCEIKARKSGAGFVTLEKWLGENDALFLKRNHAEPIVLLPWRVWAALLARVRS